MQTVRKYAFETVFSPDGAVLRDGAGTRKVFTAEEVEAERQAAYAAGREDETVRALARLGAEVSVTASAATRLVANYQADLDALRTSAAGLAIAAARAAAGVALAAFGDERVKAAVEATLAEAMPAPRLVIRVAPDAAERLRPEIGRIAQEYGFNGLLQLRDDAAHGQGDVTIDWGDGLVALRTNEIDAEIAARVRDRLTAEAATDRSPT